jgi:hypothetical protein
VPRLAYSLDEFAEAARISPSYLRRLISEGRGPETTDVGRRRLITIENGRAWLRAQTKETQAAA